MGEATIDLGPLMASRSMETWFQLEDPSGVAECSVTGAVKLKLRWNDDAMPIESSVSQFELFARRCRREEARLEGALKDRLNAFKDGMQSSRSSQGRSSFSNVSAWAPHPGPKTRLLCLLFKPMIEVVNPESS
jgi:hypothetical protein